MLKLKVELLTNEGDELDPLQLLLVDADVTHHPLGFLDVPYDHFTVRFASLIDVDVLLLLLLHALDLDSLRLGLGLNSCLGLVLLPLLLLPLERYGLGLFDQLLLLHLLSL